ncbi:MAG TPA: hypothetical protein VLV76_24555 [Candidatus Acidoferrum sp.]|nr:hypothetical protein [Candidatus Acidoferrum sp.]
MVKRLKKRAVEAPPAEELPPPVNRNFIAAQREAFEIKILAQELGITPAQVRSLRLAYGKDMPKIRQAAERLRRG